ncbi:MULTISPECIES: DUF6776 family protein [Idiomarina]|uniref:DUF6776 family protein n=1 Tax=Idiomarina TaxID=135575 RepID=UPI00101137AF|nr:MULTISPECIES: DUF6776 family protein [Idiomarina]MTJ01852.1 hypothetical protein [Idiomarina piscisalsi]RXS42580.1 hypothetical protein EST55_08915 [Idiomarina sp. 29L]
MKLYFNLKYWQKRIGRLPTFLAVAGLVVLFAYLAYLAGVWHANSLKETVREQSNQLDDMYKRLEQMEYQRHVMQVELDIERSSNQSLQDELTALQNDNYALRRDLAFYQKIMAPELQQGGVTIDSITVTPNQAEKHFHFSLAVLQIEQRRRFVEGRVAIDLVGRVNGEKRRFDLMKLANIGADERNFTMRYFSVYEGDFFMPEGLVPERIDVSVTLTDGGRGTLNRSFFWKDIRKGQPATNVRTDGDT